MGEEVAARETHGGQHRVKAARFPQVKTLDDFDFSFQRSVKRQTIPLLAQLDFLAEDKNVILLGPAGNGQDASVHPLGRPGGAAGSSSGLPGPRWGGRLGQARNAGTLEDELERLRRIPLLIVDEVGNLPFDPTPPPCSSARSHPITSERR